MKTIRTAEIPSSVFVFLAIALPTGGFAGEGSPRRVVRTTVTVDGTERTVLDYAEGRSKAELREVLINFLFDVIYLNLLVKTQDRRMVGSRPFFFDTSRVLQLVLPPFVSCPGLISPPIYPSVRRSYRKASSHRQHSGRSWRTCCIVTLGSSRCCSPQPRSLRYSRSGFRPRWLW